MNARAEPSGIRRCIVCALFAASWSIGPAEAIVAFDWTVVPTPFTSVASGPVGPGVLTVMHSGYSGGLYPVDTSGDGVPDGTLTANAELVSSVLFDGLTYAYQWDLSNLGSGALVGFLGLNTPGFAVSLLSPLYGTAGPDRIAGNADDLPVQSLSLSLVDTHPPGSEAWGGVLNPSTGLVAALLAPASVPEPTTLALLALGLAGLGFSRRREPN